MMEDDGRPFGQPALSASPTEPVPVSSASGNDQAQGFTPGPWMRDDISVTTYAPAGKPRKCIATAYPAIELSPLASLKRMRANATLMAAAPDLLATLREGRRAIGDHYAPNDCYATGPVTGDLYRDLVQCPACNLIAMYEATIAKAEGR